MPGALIFFVDTLGGIYVIPPNVSTKKINAPGISLFHQSHKNLELQDSLAQVLAFFVDTLGGIYVIPRLGLFSMYMY
jgi:hypothetical protein